MVTVPKRRTQASNRPNLLPNIRIRGGGIATACCRHLLCAAGIDAAVDPVGRAPLPAILLSDPALALIRDLFGRPDLLADLPRVTHRQVAWGPGGDIAAVEHRAITVSETELLARIGQAPEVDDDAPADFVIHSAPPLPEGELRRFGTRPAITVAVRLRDPADRASCWIEALPAGWLFLIPVGADQAWLIAVGGTVEALLAASRHLASRIALTDAAHAGFDACPRLQTPIRGDAWLACGSAAIGFDPICGDGTAQAVREAILAAAVIVAIARGGDAQALLVHYESMLLAAMRRHLMLCAQFYAIGGDGPWWRDAHAALVDGHRWCTDRLGAMPEPRYRLVGFDLVAQR
jgi:hypothetical protein